MGFEIIKKRTMGAELSSGVAIGNRANGKNFVCAITIAEDVIERLHWSDGTKVQIQRGTEHDFGRIAISETDSNDAYTLRPQSKATRILKLVITCAALAGSERHRSTPAEYTIIDRMLVIKLPEWARK